MQRPFIFPSMKLMLSSLTKLVKAVFISCSLLMTFTSFSLFTCYNTSTRELLLSFIILLYSETFALVLLFLFLFLARIPIASFIPILFKLFNQFCIEVGLLWNYPHKFFTLELLVKAMVDPLLHILCYWSNQYWREKGEN